jgi:hypothetical protein
MNPSNKLLSDIVSVRTYSKYLEQFQRREIFEETVNRTMSMHLDKFPKLSKEITKAFSLVHQFKVMPSMRSLQFSGQPIIKNNSRSYNCSCLHIKEARDFAEVLYLLLSGTGVGFSVQNHHIKCLPIVKHPVEEGIFTIQDSIAGWAQAVHVLMDAYLNAAIRPVFDFNSIRPKGAMLHTTGARAPGPEPLKYMLSVVESKLKLAIGRKLKSIEVHDVVCIISDCVLSGGIRRSSLISLFDRNDSLMLKCKTGKWWEDHPYRARANNSAVLPRSEVTKEEFLEIFKVCKNSGSGEPGFSWNSDPELNTLTNPCFGGDTKLLTSEGPEYIKNLVSTQRLLLKNHKGQKVSGRVWSNGYKQTIKLINTSDQEIVCTPDHVFMDSLGNSVMAKDLIGKRLMPFIKDSISPMIIKIQDNGEQEVFDFSLDDETHWGVVGEGYVAHNCHEISLNPYQFCNLTTVSQTGVSSKKDFLSRIYSAAFLGTLQAAYTSFPYLSQRWQETTEKEALLGVSFTGIADMNGIISNEWLREGAKLVLEVNEKYARKIGINLAARTTTVKPEGSSSCVLGSSSGVHARKGKYYLRRVQINKDDVLYEYLKTMIPDLIEDAFGVPNTAVITIPQESPGDAVTEEKEDGIQLFDRVMDYNKNWVAIGHRSGYNKHNVSCTLSLETSEWDKIAELMWKERENYTGISLFPKDDSVYQQAPFEVCTKEIFEKLSKSIPELDLTKLKEFESKSSLIESVACGGGSCEVSYLK